MQTWRCPNAGPLELHPFDRDPAGWDALLKTDIFNHPFQNWEEFRTNIRPADQTPLFVNDAVDTYYHGWQVFLLADALDMTLTAILDLRQEEVIRAALGGDWSALGATPKWESVSFLGMSGLRASEKWLRHFDATAQYKETCQRILDSADVTEHRGGWRLEGQARQEVIEKERSAGNALLGKHQISDDEVISFVKWLCERWDEWHHRGRPLIAGEYKRFIGGAVHLLRRINQQSFAEIATKVGQVTGHSTNTLDAVFPDRVIEMRQALSLTLLHSVLPKLPAADPAIMPTTVDVGEFLDWLDRKKEFSIHHINSGIIERQFKGDSIDKAALSKGVAALTTTFEILITELLRDRLHQELNIGNTLMQKLQTLWKGWPGVRKELRDNWSLTNTKAQKYQDQLSKIEALPENVAIAKKLLRASLLRNECQHNSIADWNEDQALDGGLEVLGSLLYCWRAAALLQPPSSP